MAKKTAFDNWLLVHPYKNEIKHLLISLNFNLLKNEEIDALFSGKEEIETSVAAVSSISDLLIKKNIIHASIFTLNKDNTYNLGDIKFIEESLTKILDALSQFIEIKESYNPDSPLVNFETIGETIITSELEFSRIKALIQYIFAALYFTGKRTDDNSPKELLSRLPSFLTRQYKKYFYHTIMIIIFFILLCIMIFPQNLLMIPPFLFFAAFVLYTLAMEGKKRYRRLYDADAFIAPIRAEIVEYSQFNQFKSMVNKSVVKEECCLIELKISLNGSAYQLPIWVFDNKFTEEFLEGKIGETSNIEILHYDNTLFGLNIS